MEKAKPEDASPVPMPAIIRRSPRIKTGVFLLVANIPFGLAGLGLAGTMAALTGRKAFWGVIGVTIYGLSWAMLGLGVILAGPQGVQYVRKLKRKWFGRK